MTRNCFWAQYTYGIGFEEYGSFETIEDAVKAILDERIKNKKELQKKCKELGYDPDKLEETLAELESKLEEYKTNLEELIVSLSKKLSEHDAQN